MTLNNFRDNRYYWTTVENVCGGGSRLLIFNFSIISRRTKQDPSADANPQRITAYWTALNVKLSREHYK